MKRKYIYAALLYAFTVAVIPAVAGQPQQEKIGRGVVAVKTDEGSFRQPGVTSAPTALRRIQPLPGRENQRRTDHDIDQLRRQGGTSGSVYVVKRVDYGKETDSSEETGVWDKFYRKIKLQRPPRVLPPPYSVTNGDDKEDYPNGQTLLIYQTVVV